jgi:hypothetical protein
MSLLDFLSVCICVHLWPNSGLAYRHRTAIVTDDPLRPDCEITSGTLSPGVTPVGM